ncbi:MAG: SH3 domain-containing protein [Bacteroidota bacterium]
MKPTTIVLIYCLCILAACNTSAPAPDQQAMELPQGEFDEPKSTLGMEHIPSETNAENTPKPKPGYDYEKDFEAIVIGDCVRFRSSPNRASGVAYTSNFGDLVHVLDISEDRESISDDPLCDSYGYHWYNTTGANDKEGWVFGKFLYVRPQTGQLFSTEMEKWVSRVSDKEYELNGTNYRFDFAIDQSIGSSDEDGLTGCDQYAFPVFYEKGSPKIQFVKYKELGDFGGRLEMNRGFLQFLWDSEGGHEDVLSVEVKNNEGRDFLELKIRHYYQDGTSESILIISEQDGNFQLVSATNSGFIG